ncbi:DUF7736 domain-containing protein [Alteromonas sp. RKMC-009]|uniref:DUF7736 domain-containing protein n=1 Tax=Alteromonas sp. RKMC-009 TaxID=2267264 RepID=UPI000E67DFF3
MDIQRLRNLTTGILHTDIGHVYEDIEAVTGKNGLMTHMIPNMLKAIEPWLKENVTDERYWNKVFDTEHQGEYSLPQPSESERDLMIQRFQAMPDPLLSQFT